jgi:glutathione S-transferase
MKLYGSLASPYVARCWLAVAAKGGGADLEMYEDGIKSDNYLAMSPIGKMPLLVDGDTSIPESAVICEYLDATLPGPALMPADAAGQARVRLLCHLTDIYVYPAVLALLKLPTEGDSDAIKTTSADALASLDYLEHFFADGGFAYGDALTLADATVHGVVSIARPVLAKHGVENVLDGRPRLAAWWAAINENETLKPALDEIKEAVTAFRKRRAEEAAIEAAAE